MQAFKRLNHTWPKRGPAERRLYPRLKSRFPVVLDPGERSGSISCWTRNVSIGGMVLRSPTRVEAFLRVELTFDVPVTDKHNEVSIHRFQVPATVLRLEPDDPEEEVEEIAIAVKFNDQDTARDGILATFMLQMDLFDPESSLT
jgi:hypothetical protein